MTYPITLAQDSFGEGTGRSSESGARDRCVRWTKVGLDDELAHSYTVQSSSRPSVWLCLQNPGIGGKSGESHVSEAVLIGLTKLGSNSTGTPTRLCAWNTSISYTAAECANQKISERMISTVFNRIKRVTNSLTIPCQRIYPARPSMQQAMQSKFEATVPENADEVAFTQPSK